MEKMNDPVLLVLGIGMLLSGLMAIVQAARHGITTTVTRRYEYPTEQSVNAPNAYGAGWRVYLGDWLIRMGMRLIQNNEMYCPHCGELMSEHLISTKGGYCKPAPLAKKPEK